MVEKIGNFFRNMIVGAFYIAANILRQKPHIEGRANLYNVPTPMIFTLTHDTYFEVPSLSRLYFSLKPKPDFFILGKTDMLSGRYLTMNFGKKNRVLRYILTMLDKTGLPKLIFKTMKVTTIHRPFAESYEKDRDEIKTEIGSQLGQLEDRVTRGQSTLIFPEGTTWGFGGLKKIRSAVYQVVENAVERARRKVYLLPVNVKVDGLMKGRKDIFIKVGKPVFIQSTRERFNRKLSDLLNRLHTITFSQIAAYYIRRIAEHERDAKLNCALTPDTLSTEIGQIVHEIKDMSDRKLLPQIDARLCDKEYLELKLKRFIKYCRKKDYLVRTYLHGRKRAFYLNINAILSTYPEKLYRKLNPLGFYANELISLGEQRIRQIYDHRLGNGLISSGISN